MLAVKLLLMRDKPTFQSFFLVLLRFYLTGNSHLLRTQLFPVVLVIVELCLQLLALRLALACFFEFALVREFLLFGFKLGLSTLDLCELVVNVLDLGIEVVQRVTLVFKSRY